MRGRKTPQASERETQTGWHKNVNARFWTRRLLRTETRRVTNDQVAKESA
jgi:hypothetical protein